MKKYKYHYTVCNVSDVELYEKQCIALEENIPNIITIFKLDAVDGTDIAKYEVQGKNILVKNSDSVDSVYIDSDIELEQFFKNK